MISSATSMTFGHRAGALRPAGAWWVGPLTTWLARGVRRLEAYAELRAVRRDAPAPWEPRDADEVLAWAAQLEATDPGFANDLRAAVWRSQRETN